MKNRLGQALHLMALGRPEAAVRPLRLHLTSWNPYLANASPALQDVAGAYVRLTAKDPAEAGTIDWALYLCRTARRLHGATGERAMSAALTLVDLVRRRGRPQAGTLPEFAGDGFNPETPTATRLAAARLLHGHGLCEPAHREATAALYRWESGELDSAERGTYLIDAVSMLDRCGRAARAHVLLTAYAATLPAAGTDESDLLVAQAAQSLGVPDDIARHRLVCGLPKERRHARSAVRESTLYLLSA